MELRKKISPFPKTVCLALDPAHGINVKGKASPDKLHREYKWSRNMISGIIEDIGQIKNNRWDIVSPLLENPLEIGISKRVDMYNELSRSYDMLIVLSLHNDAYKDPPAWWNGPGGFTFFTSRGDTDADYLCSALGEGIQKYMPKERFRFDFGLSKGEKMKDLDREANFGVIYGYKRNGKLIKANYSGILAENNFMDVQSDYRKLMDPSWNEKLQGAYVFSILCIMSNMGFENFVFPVTKKAQK